jgi:signal transduction histidine kinase/ActR/RegA family two-component response regulator
LVADAGTIGVFIVGSKDEPKPISETAIDLARTLANLSALTLSNASLYRAGKDHAAQLERSLVERGKEDAERKRLQEQLTQAQKLESVGRLAGGVAHDFNNMLAVILGHADLALDCLSADHPLRNHLSQIQSAAERSSELTKQLLAFARKQTIDPKILDLNDAVGNLLRMLHRLIGEDIHLAWLPDPELGLVCLDPAQIDQILANLCVNARDAISGVGNIIIETSNAVFDEDYCEGRPGFKPGQYVMVAVSDNGVGMDRETQKRLFEPFFTTKEEGKGTGLGLATVYGIVKQNRGFVNVYSEPGQGTTIKIYLPRESVLSVEHHLPAVRQSSLRGDETVLIVEDEQAVLELGKEMLEPLGYSILTASEPAAALDIARRQTKPIDILVTDVVMPGMNGRELSKQLEVIYPNLKTLFMSGYTANVIAHHGILDDGVHLLSKPFSKSELASSLRSILDGQSPARGSTSPQTA